MTTYAILGSGNIGSAIARQFARKHLDVALANARGPESLAALVTELGASVRAVSIEEALRADIVIVAIPFTAIAAVMANAAAWNGRIVVDASNAIEFPAFTATDLGGRPSSEVVADAVPGARVVKAFNTLPAALLAADPTHADGRRVLFASSNDAAASATVAALIHELGFHAIELGALAAGGLLQQFGGALTNHDLIKRN